MAYDYSTDKAGPIAPMSFVRQAISAAKKAVDDDSKLVLGVALYGYNWPIATVGTCPADQEGKTSVSQRNIDELLAKRIGDPGARPGDRRVVVHLSTAKSPTARPRARRRARCTTSTPRARANASISLARERLGAVSLWALGFDCPATWQSIGPAGPHPGIDDTGHIGRAP